jgi:nucleoside-diphosphate-sugar epimerase
MASACVTGATGYVASELIRQLLGKGYKIKATVRCPVDSPRLQYLHDIARSSSGSLDLVQVPDLQQGSEALDTALAGSQYVFHVASPFRFDGDPDLDIVQPAVRGTKAVLEAAAKQKPGLKRVVVTSSVCGKQASVEQLLPDLHYVIMYGDYQL